MKGGTGLQIKVAHVTSREASKRCDDEETMKKLNGNHCEDFELAEIEPREVAVLILVVSDVRVVVVGQSCVNGFLDMACRLRPGKIVSRASVRLATNCAWVRPSMGFSGWVDRPGTFLFSQKL